MANAQKGEVILDVDGQRITLAADVNALCELETETGQVFQQVAAKADAGSFVAIRWLLWTMTRRHHPQLSLTDVGALITRIGMDRLTQAFADVSKSMVPDAKDAKDLKLRPRKARTGTT
jgi:hypothetical protein